jgi:SAM-dependent MidA family methyltransferase
VPLREAWHRALYGDQGFYRRESPGDHFRTSAHVGRVFAEAIAELARRLDVESAFEIGAGAGELLTGLAACAPDLSLAGVELRSRPPSLPRTIRWGPDPPTSARGLVLAHEFLDNIACDVAEMGPGGRIRLVEVDPESGQQRLGEPLGLDGASWLDTWWPLVARGDRAEVGIARETTWAGIRQANPDAWLLAVDFGHLRSNRPTGGSLSSYRHGRQTAVSFDRRHDVTAAVAFDALADAVIGELRQQRDWLPALGVSAARPELRDAQLDPAHYLDRLAKATLAQELTASDGLGDFYWLLSPPMRGNETATTSSRLGTSPDPVTEFPDPVVERPG